MDGTRFYWVDDRSLYEVKSEYYSSLPVQPTDEQILMQNLQLNPLYVPKGVAPATERVHQVRKKALPAAPSQHRAKKQVGHGRSISRHVVGAIVGIVIAAGVMTGGYFMLRSTAPVLPGDSLFLKWGPMMPITAVGVLLGGVLGTAAGPDEDD